MFSTEKEVFVDESTALFLRAHQTRDFHSRIALVRKAFWDRTYDLDDIIESVSRTYEELKMAQIPALIPIGNCGRLLGLLVERSEAGNDEWVTRDWFTGAVIGATGWSEKERVAGALLATHVAGKHSPTFGATSQRPGHLNTQTRVTDGAGSRKVARASSSKGLDPIKITYSLVAIFVAIFLMGRR